jgi:hypothetical protein
LKSLERSQFADKDPDAAARGYQTLLETTTEPGWKLHLLKDLAACRREQARFEEADKIYPTFRLSPGQIF